MIMYVLLGETDYEGDTLLGVYATQEAAEAAYQVWIADQQRFDGHRVQQVEVGAAAQYHW